MDAHEGVEAIASPPLRRLAASYGVQTRHVDMNGLVVDADLESVVAVLRALGAPIDSSSDDDVRDAVRERRRAWTRRVLPPAAAVWDDDAFGVRVIVPAARGSTSLTSSLTLESGEVRTWAPSARTVLRSVSVDGAAYLVTRLPLPSLPYGYHRLTVGFRGIDHECLLLRAPTTSYRKPDPEKKWGAFAPLYALHSRHSAGIGNFSDLEAVVRWVRRHGGAFVGTLPFLASYPHESSPYSPVSRLFWNELYVPAGPPARPEPVLDYAALHERQRGHLERQPRDPEALARFQDAFPLALDYARFRAAASARGSSWRSWSEPLRSGLIEEAAVDDDEVLHHLYSQLACERALERVPGLYLDLPLGVHRDGYDPWREQTLFADGVDVGAPPDAAFPSGQNWSTPPVLPHKSREQGHRYFRSCVRHAMRHAELLRVDHVMGLDRQFWIPSSGTGVYVRYPADELYAILSIESHRAQCELVGENLGLVPGIVRERMRRHGLRGLYVRQLTPDQPIPDDVVASLNTHDTEMFATYANRSRDALWRELAELLGSDAQLVSIAIEDLWLETERHNVPGTTSERPNWRRPMRYALEELDERIGDVVDGFQR